MTQVSGAVVSAASVIAYIITEGKVDAEGVKKVVDERVDCPEEAGDLGCLQGVSGE